MESTDEYTRRSAAADVAPTAPAPAATAAQRLATRRFTMRAAPQILPMTPAEHRLVHALQNSQRPSNLRGLLTAVLLAKNRAAAVRANRDVVQRNPLLRAKSRVAGGPTLGGRRLSIQPHQFANGQKTPPGSPSTGPLPTLEHAVKRQDNEPEPKRNRFADAYQRLRTTSSFIKERNEDDKVETSHTGAASATPETSPGGGADSQRRLQCGKPSDAVAPLAKPVTPSKPAALRGGTNLLADRLRFLKCEMIIMKGDGNCQFRSAAFNLFGDQEYHKAVRKKAVAEILRNKNTYEVYFEPSEFQSYIRDMAKLRTWGDELTLRAISDAYGCVVHVITSTEANWYLVYTPQPSPEAMSENSAKLEEAGDNQSRTASDPSECGKPRGATQATLSAGVCTPNAESNSPGTGGQRAEPERRIDKPVRHLFFSYIAPIHYNAFKSFHAETPRGSTGN
eukprot:GHVT01048006.1.p1 GENE.GHVT01048006.1~~GHVT01048006.1.p1  ORF type:complete len:451 (+),score=42.89 GHVT01048006.1:831-2183(+)